MAIEFAMPKLGLTMEQGTIIEWLVPDGSAVAAGSPVLVIETDKVETEVEAPADGLLHRSGEVGQSFACGQRIGWFLAPGEQPPAAGPAAAGTAAPAGPAAVPAAAGASSATGAGVARSASAAARGEGGRLLASPNAKRVAAALGVDLTRVTGTGPGGRIVSEDVEAAAAAGTAAVGLPVGGAGGSAPAGLGVPVPAAAIGLATNATAAAVQLAQLVGLDLATAGVRTLSPDGRIGREDVAEHVRALIARAQGLPAATAPAPAAAVAAPPSPAPAAPAQAAPPAASQTPSRIIPMAGMRGTIAARMTQSLRDMAQLTLTVDADADAIVADRTARRASGAEVVPGYTDYVIAAVARALQRHPHVNSQVTPEGIAVLPAIHIGMAVALEKGLVVPVVRDPLARPLEDLAAETTRLAEAARAGRLGLADYEGGTFSVTALGSYGVDAFTPVINPPNAAILGVGRIREDVAWDGDTPRRVRRMVLSLTWDHRVFDGAPAAEFAQEVVSLLRTPAALG